MEIRNNHLPIYPVKWIKIISYVGVVGLFFGVASHAYAIDPVGAVSNAVGNVANTAVNSVANTAGGVVNSATQKASNTISNAFTGRTSGGSGSSSGSSKGGSTDEAYYGIQVSDDAVRQLGYDANKYIGVVDMNKTFDSYDKTAAQLMTESQENAKTNQILSVAVSSWQTMSQVWPEISLEQMLEKMEFFKKHVKAGVPNPVRVADYTNDAASLAAEVIDVVHESDVSASLNVVQAEQLETIQGAVNNAGSTASAKDSAVETGYGNPLVQTSGEQVYLASQFYNYVNENVLKKPTASPYTELQSRLGSGGDYESIVKDLFFVSKSNPTAEEELKMEQKRKVYAEAIALTYAHLGAGAQQALAADLRTIASEAIAGTDLINDVVVDSATLIMLIQVTAAEIAMQIQLMELEAAQALIAQPVNLIAGGA